MAIKPTNFKNGLAVDDYTMPLYATLTAGAEDTNVVNVAIQLYADAAGTIELDNVTSVEFWISDASTGIGLAATAPSGGFAIGTDGDVLAEVVSGKYALIQSEADGDIDIDVTETGADTFYAVIRVPATGRVFVSNALTFAS